MVAAIVIVLWKLTASLSSDVFERRASTENEFFFSPLICPDALVDVRRSDREIKIHVYAKQQTWICTTWLSFPLIFRLLFIASTQK